MLYIICKKHKRYIEAREIKQIVYQNETSGLCALASFGHSVARVKFERVAPLKAKIWSFKYVDETTKLCY